MSFAMMVITNSGIRGALPLTICLICLTLMWLEAVLGLCLGCEIHGLLVRRGWVAQGRGVRDLRARRLRRHPPLTALPNHDRTERRTTEESHHRTSTTSRAPTRLCALRANTSSASTARCPCSTARRAPYINLDNAASTPVLREVLETVERVHALVFVGPPRHRLQEPRRHAGLRGCAPHRRAASSAPNEREHVVIFGKNTTEAINKLAHRLPLPPDDVVLVSQMEHHSNDLPWRATPARVVHIGFDALGRLDEAHLDRLLRRASPAA